MHFVYERCGVLALRITYAIRAIAESQTSEKPKAGLPQSLAMFGRTSAVAHRGLVSRRSWRATLDQRAKVKCGRSQWRAFDWFSSLKRLAEIRQPEAGLDADRRLLSTARS